MEPTSAAVASGFALSKIYYGLSALFMAMIVLFLRRTPAIHQHGKMATGAIVGGTAVGTSVIFGGWLTVYAGFNPHDANTALAIGGVIGLVSFTAIKAIVLLFDRMDGKDIVEIVQEAKKVTGSVVASPAPTSSVIEPTKPVTKPVAKRATRRTTK